DAAEVEERAKAKARHDVDEPAINWLMVIFWLLIISWFIWNLTRSAQQIGRTSRGGPIFIPGGGWGGGGGGGGGGGSGGAGGAVIAAAEGSPAVVATSAAAAPLAAGRTERWSPSAKKNAPPSPAP